MITDKQKIREALKAYHETGTRELPSVDGPKSRGVPRSFLKAVDELVAALEAAVDPKAKR